MRESSGDQTVVAHRAGRACGHIDDYTDNRAVNLTYSPRAGFDRGGAVSIRNRRRRRRGHMRSTGLSRCSPLR